MAAEIIGSRKDVSEHVSEVELMDLPDEMLTDISLRVGTFREIEQLQNVCTRFKTISDGIVRRGFIKFQRDVDAEIVIAKSDYERVLSEISAPPKNPIPTLNLAHRLHVFDSLGSEFAVLKALSWTGTLFAPPEDTSAPSGCLHSESVDILDQFVSELKTVQETATSTTHEEDFLILTSRLKWFTMDHARKIGKGFHLTHVPDNYFGSAEVRDMLAGMPVLSLLEICKDATCNEACINEFGDRSRIRVRYTMNRCWFESHEPHCFDTEQPFAQKLQQIVQSIKVRVLNINCQHLEKERSQRCKSVTGHGNPGTTAICSVGMLYVEKEYIFWFYLVQNPLTNQMLEQHSKIQFDIDAMCYTKDFPKSLIEKCKPDCSMNVEEDCSFELMISSAFLYYGEPDPFLGDRVNSEHWRPISPLHYQARRRAVKDDAAAEDDSRTNAWARDDGCFSANADPGKDSDTECEARPKRIKL